MMKLSDEGRRALGQIAGRYGVSEAAVEHLLMAVISGHGTQAQFNHPDLGGMGQWSLGGMIMIGDMFNNGLKATVANLCAELSVLASNLPMPSQPMSSQSQYQGDGTSLFIPGSFSSGNWWPEELGQAASTGAQNNLRYAFFPATRRLAIDIGGRITVYDTADHQIGGFSQQQGSDQSLNFTSQYGLVRVADLAVIIGSGERAEQAPLATAMPSEPSMIVPSASTPAPSVTQPAWTDNETHSDIFDKIERLAALHAKGILTDQEFQSKKAELLDRI